MLPVRIDIRGLNVGEEDFNYLKGKYPSFIKFTAITDEIVEEIEISVPSSFEKANDFLWEALGEKFPDLLIRKNQLTGKEYFSVSLTQSDCGVVETVSRIIETQVRTALSWSSYNNVLFLKECLLKEDRNMSKEERFLLEEMITPIIDCEFRYSVAERSGRVVNLFHDSIIEGRHLNEEEKENLQTNLDSVRRDSEREAAILSPIALVLTVALIAGFVCFFVFYLHPLVLLGLFLFGFVAGGAGVYAWATGGESKISLNICDKIEHRFLRKQSTDTEDEEEAQTTPNLTWGGFFKRVLTQRVRPQQANTPPILAVE